MVSVQNDSGSIDLQTPSLADMTITESSCSITTPLVLRRLHPVPVQEMPEYVYDPQRQIATDLAGAPWAPRLEKQWTTTAGTHTDGDGGDNENWGWEE